MDVGGTVMGEEVAGKKDLSGTEPAEMPFTTFQGLWKEEKYYLEQKGSCTKLLFEEQSLDCPLNTYSGFFRF